MTWKHEIPSDFDRGGQIRQHFGVPCTCGGLDFVYPAVVESAIIHRIHITSQQKKIQYGATLCHDERSRTGG